MAGRARRRRRARGRRTRAVPARAARRARGAPPARAAARGRDAVREHDPRRRGAALPGRPAARGTPRGGAALERARDGGPREPRLRRARRPHRELRVGGRSVRGRIQPFLPRGGRRVGRRSRLFPASFVAGRLCARVSRRLPERRAARSLPARDRRAGPVLVPASVADARLLAISDGLDGHRPDQRDLPGALHALPAEPRPVAHRRPQGMGLLRRRRDGRAGIDRRAVARGARGARQSRVRDQLQPAAPRRPGARQRPHRRRARVAVRGRGLERDQGALGLRLGRAVRARRDGRARARVRADGRRPVPDVLGERRRVQPRALLRPGRRARGARRASARRGHRPAAPRRPRRAQAVRRV